MGIPRASGYSTELEARMDKQRGEAEVGNQIFVKELNRGKELLEKWKITK
jgi:hypothetical protein